jgi:hypothetical protein
MRLLTVATVTVALVSCGGKTRSTPPGPPPAPLGLASTPAPAKSAQSVQEVGSAATVQPPVAASIRFVISSFGPAGDPGSPPLADWAPKRKLQLFRVECAPGAPAKPRRTEPVASVPGEVPALPPMVCKPGWRRPLGANLASSISTFDSGNARLARLSACFKVQERTASRRLLDALFRARFPGVAPQGVHTEDASAAPASDPAELEKALILAANQRPAVFAVHTFTKAPVFEPCPVRDCEKYRRYRRKFSRFQDVEELQIYAADGKSARELFVPAGPREVALSLLDDGASAELLVEARAGRWDAAQQLAADRVAHARGSDVVAFGIALANLAVTRMFTRDRGALRATIDEFRALALPAGRPDVSAARQNIDRAREDAMGLVWYGVDPCAP